MARSLTDDLDKILAAICRSYANVGQAREVAILGHASATIQETRFDNWNGGVTGYTIYLEVPDFLYTQLTDGLGKLEQDFAAKASEITKLYEQEYIESFKIVPELIAEPDWKEKAKTYVTGQGLSNQGRVRSDNLAPKSCDGLLFRSQPEIHLYRAFKSLGVSFAPLPVFIRGGDSYRRIEPDFVVLKGGIVLIVEVDGDNVHRETPVDAHDRTTMLAHEGAHIERVNASDCDTPVRAKACAERLLAILEKIKKNR